MNARPPTVFIVRAADPHPWAGRPFGVWSSAKVVGLRYPEECRKWLGAEVDDDVVIHPGMDHGLGDQDNLARALLGTLYDLLQVDQGGELVDGDEFEIDGLRWKYRVFESIHVVPVVETFPAGMWDRINEAERRRQREELKYLYG